MIPARMAVRTAKANMETHCVRRILRTILRGSFYPRLAALVALLIAVGAAWGADAPDSGSSQTNRIFWMIPHTHWEGAVFKTREEYLQMGLPHILTALRLLKENPDYRFTLDQVAYFRPFLERYPEDAVAFRKFVLEGRLQIVGGMNVMPDDNMPSGESFVRQLLYAKRYVRDALGVDVKTGWLVDTFGHHAQMPQILRLAGINSFWFSRGVEDRNTMPSEFMWQGLDGTCIPAFWLPHSYGLLAFPPRDFGQFNNYVRHQYDALAAFSRGSGERVGMSGADVTDPELYAPDLVKRFNEQPDKPFTLRFGVPADFEIAMAGRTNLPVITGERNPLFQGVYSSRIELKQRMRETERLLTTAEKFGALANWLGAAADEAMIWRAWEPALFNVTHDLASGVMTDDVYADTLRGYDFSQRLGGQMLEQNIDSVLARIDTRGAGAPLVVFNMLGWTRTDAAEGEADFAAGGVVDFDLRDDAGKLVPAQIEEVNRYADGKLRQVRFVFVARDIPALGHAVYHVVPRQTGDRSSFGSKEQNSRGEMENEFLRASFDLATGALNSLRAKAGDWEVLSGPGNVVAVEPDHGDVWELYHNLDGGQNLIMTRPLPAPKAGQAHYSNEETGKPGTIWRGPVYSEFEVSHPFGSNTFTTVARLYAGIDRLDFQTKILNQDKFVRYQLLMPSAIKNGRNFQEIPFGACERPMHQEFPAQNWMDCSDGAHGVALLNRGMPGNNNADGTLMLSLMRSTRIQSYGIGGGFEGQSSDSALELGKELTFHYALMPHSGGWNEARVYRAGLEFNQPLIVRKASEHRGKLPPRWGFADISAPGVVLSALKLSRDGSTVIRVYEADGRAVTNATLQLHAKVLSANEANLMEDAGMKLKVRKDAVQFDLHPFEIKTFKLRLEPVKADK
jgi:alpha-mannosidase